MSGKKIKSNLYLKLGYRHISGLKNGEEGTLIEPKTKYYIGRDIDNDIKLDPNDTDASRSHAEISCTEIDVWLTDTGSHNGTYLNGKIVKRAQIKIGDKIRFGENGPTIEITDFQIVKSRRPYVLPIILGVLILGIIIILSLRLLNLELRKDKYVEINKELYQRLLQQQKDMHSKESTYQAILDSLANAFENNKRTREHINAILNGSQTDTVIIPDSILIRQFEDISNRNQSIQAKLDSMQQLQSLRQSNREQIYKHLCLLHSNYLLVDKDGNPAYINPKNGMPSNKNKYPFADFTSATSLGIILNSDGLVIGPKILIPPAVPEVFAKANKGYNYKPYDIMMYYPQQKKAFRLIPDTLCFLEDLALMAYYIDSVNIDFNISDINKLCPGIRYLPKPKENIFYYSYIPMLLDSIRARQNLNIDFEKQKKKSPEIFNAMSHKAFGMALNNGDLETPFISGSIEKANEYSFLLEDNKLCGPISLILNEQCFIIGIFSKNVNKGASLDHIEKQMEKIANIGH